jgi:hypothetical protein
MATNPSDKYRQNAIVEGGKSGSGGSSMADKALTVGGVGVASAPFITAYRADEAMSNRREAEAEMKREKRGVEKTPTDRAREDAREMRMMELNDKASRAASRDMGMKKGGKVSSASSRADGIAQRGKTRGKMVMCGGGRV